MKVIAFACQKGGSGKTTLAGHVAVQADLAGAGPVAILDADPQGSLSDWWRERDGTSIALAQSTESGLHEDLRRLRERGIKLVVIDTPPAITSTISHVIGVSDLVVVPTKPSPHDLRAVGATVQLCKELSRKMIFVVNGAAPRARITAEAIAALSHHGPVCSTILHQRVDFAASMIDGRTVNELPGRSRSKSEVVSLWNYLQEMVNDENASRIMGAPVSISMPQTTREDEQYRAKSMA